ncbi:SsrA-binding protein SmpB [bacterium]|nr:SsrA-binding protein SmpB [bacterium]
MASPDNSGILIVAENRKAFRDYEITELFEAGISLLGSEVKSIRGGGINLKDSYVQVRSEEVFLYSCHISPYAHSRVDAHRPERMRKLLLNRKEIDRLQGLIQQKGLTIIPLKVYFKKGKCKFELGVGRGKKSFDKRQDIKKKETDRRIARALSRK